MIISAGLPTCMEGMMYPVPFANPDDIVAIGVAAEKLGYHSVWGNDHMTTQHYVRDLFPAPPNFWELLITLSFVAAATETLKLGTGMLVTPMRRDIVVVAKQIATLDMFSKGRALLGVGVGAYREEFEALNPSLKAHRGRMVEESLEAFHILFNERDASFHGEYYQFESVEMYPKPFQDSIPIYVGGNSSQAVERAARYGTGWLPAAMRASQIRDRTSILRELLAARGRSYDEVDVAIQYMVRIDKTREEAIENFRNSQMYHHVMSLRKSTLKDHDLEMPEDWNLIGTAPQVVEQAQELEEAGLKHLCGLYFVGNTVEEVISQMQVFSEQVMPHIQG